MSEPRASEDPPSINLEYSRLLIRGRRLASSSLATPPRSDPGMKHRYMISELTHKMAVQLGPQINNVGCGLAKTASTVLFKTTPHLDTGPRTCFPQSTCSKAW